MHLEIVKHDGPARLGRLHLDDLTIPTPSIFWSNAAGPATPLYLELSTSAREQRPVTDYGTIFSQEKIDRFGILPSFPSGFDVPREIAGEAVIETLKVAARHPRFGAVVEGGRYIELRRQCAEDLKDRPLLRIADPDKLLKNHRRLVEVVTTIREVASPNTALYMPDAPPHLYPILVYMGVDMFDLKRPILCAHERMYLTPTGISDAESFVEFPCPCEVCAEGKEKLDMERLLLHNVLVSTACIRDVRESVRIGRLRNLVEEKAACDSTAMGALRILDHERQDFLERYTPMYPSLSLEHGRGR